MRFLKDKNIILHIVGDPYPENPLSLTSEQMRKYCTPNIVWLGQQTDILSIWKNAHIALLPSYREGLPKSLLEAAACGRPMITTDVPGCHEVVQDNVNGLLAPVKSPKHIAKAILKLATDKALRKKLGKNAQKSIVTCFSDDIIIQQTLRVYENCFSRY